MSLFPAYGPPGGQKPPPKSNRGGGDDPPVITLDSVDSSDEGELPSSPEEDSNVQAKEKQKSSTSKKNKKSRKRSRSHSKSRNNKRRRSRSASVEEVNDSESDNRNYSRDKDKKGKKKSRRDSSKERYVNNRGRGDGQSSSRGYDNGQGNNSRHDYYNSGRGQGGNRDNYQNQDSRWGEGRVERDRGRNDNFHQDTRYLERDGGRGRGRNDNYQDSRWRDGQVERDGGRSRNNDYQDNRRDHRQVERSQEDNNYYEQQRLRTVQMFPRKVFLEEVNLQPEFAFRLDTEGAQRNVESYSLSQMQKSMYQHEGTKVIGATDQELIQIYNKFNKFRTVLPQGIDDNGNPIEETNTNDSTVLGLGTSQNTCELGFKIDKRGSTGNNPNRPPLDLETFISLGKSNGDQRGRRNDYNSRDGFESNIAPRKDGELSMKQKIEKYNSDLRLDTKNIVLWKEFIEFQDQVFEESSHIYDYDDGGGNQNIRQQGPKKKKHRKALVEKKVAILEKALETNPRNLELHTMRLDLYYEIKKPGFVLTEWKKIVANNQQLTPFWVEYLRFASTQLQIYSSSSSTSVFDKCFLRFKQMLTPSFPDFQRPSKFPLVIADVLLAFSLMLKNAGFREKSIALHQAQLEVDLFCPVESLGDQTLIQLNKEDRKLFEIFWDLGTPKFGEHDAPGWKTVLETKSITKSIVSVPESNISEFEDQFFEFANQDEGLNDEMKKRQNWLYIESLRSKLNWLPWRENCSDVEDVDDTQRIVLGSDLSPFIIPVPLEVHYVTHFDRQSAYFRHVVNFLITLQEDFVPHTHTMDSVISIFTSLSLTESRSLFSEVFYWKKLLNLYVKEVETSSELRIPEGFRLLDLTSAGTFVQENSSDPSKKISLNQSSPKIEEGKNNLLGQNQSIHMSMIRSIIDKAIDMLDPPFSILLFEMYLRFEQKNSFGNTENYKSRLKNGKNLMKKSKLRNTMGCYRELGMLEYFGGKKVDAIDIFVKTINLGCTTLKIDETTEIINLEEDWEVITQLTQLYRQLTELNLVDNEPMAYQVIALLGAGFKPVKTDIQNQVKVKKNVMLKALRNFERIFAQLLPGVELEEQAEQESPQLKEAIETKWDGDKCIEFLVQKSNLIVEWTRSFALFQYFAKDFEAASQVYTKALAQVRVSEGLNRSGNYDQDSVNRHNIREQLYISWCNLGAHALSKNPMVNSKFRNILGKALEEFPSSPPLLLLFTDVENQMSIAGKLWRMMVGLVKHDGGCNHWAPLFMGLGLAKKIDELERDEVIGLDSFGLGGPAVPPNTIFYKLDSLLTAAQQNTMTRNCPLIWRVHMKLLALRTKEGKDVIRATGTFYDAVRHCPSVKALYLDGVTYFPEMLKEITDLMAEKQLYIRLPLEELEVLLEIENEASAGVMRKNKKRKESSSDVEIISD